MKGVSQLFRRPAIAYIITSLSMGGAQKVLLQLLASELKWSFAPVCVIALRRVSGLEAQFAELEIPVVYLEVERPWLIPSRLLEVIRLLRRREVRILYSLLHHGNLFAALLKPVFKLLTGREIKLIWSMHDTPLPGLYTRRDHRFFMWLNHKLSRIPERIILVSVRSRERYIYLYYPLKKLTLIPNGVPVPTNNRRAIVTARRGVRAELELGKHAVLIGSLTRYVVEKDIPCMLEAFSLLCFDEPNTFLLLVGEGMEPDNAELSDLITKLGLIERVILLGVQGNAQYLLRALDIATLSSRSEALPLFIAEAMAEGIPCVASRVGDVPLLLGDTGCLVKAESPQALADGWRQVLAMSGAERWEMAAAAQERVAKEFSEQSMVERHEALFKEVLSS